jgi:hypothetical protein
MHPRVSFTILFRFYHVNAMIWHFRTADSRLWMSEVWQVWRPEQI